MIFELLFLEEISFGIGMSRDPTMFYLPAEFSEKATRRFPDFCRRLDSEGAWVSPWMRGSRLAISSQEGIEDGSSGKEPVQFCPPDPGGGLFHFGSDFPG
jgi:hypothetical protein